MLDAPVEAENSILFSELITSETTVALISIYRCRLRFYARTTKDIFIGDLIVAQRFLQNGGEFDSWMDKDGCKLSQLVSYQW